MNLLEKLKSKVDDIYIIKNRNSVKCECCNELDNYDYLNNKKELNGETEEIVTEIIKKNYINFHSGDDWTSFTYYVYCKSCLNVYSLTKYFTLEDEDEDSNFILMSEENKDFLEEICYTETIDKLSYVYNELLENRPVYVYDRMEYDLGIDPLYSECPELFESDYFSHVEVDIKNTPAMYKNNSVHWRSSGLCRLLINEKDLEWEVGITSSGLSGYLNSSNFKVLKSKVKSIEFYDILNDVWVSSDSTELDTVKLNNEKWIKENEKSLTRERPIESLRDYIYSKYNKLISD